MQFGGKYHQGPCRDLRWDAENDLHIMRALETRDDVPRVAKALREQAVEVRREAKELREQTVEVRREAKESRRKFRKPLSELGTVRARKSRSK